MTTVPTHQLTESADVMQTLSPKAATHPLHWLFIPSRKLLFGCGGRLTVFKPEAKQNDATDRPGYRLSNEPLRLAKAAIN